MHVVLATEPASSTHPNEDFVAAGTDTLVLLDGAGTPHGSQSGCMHGVAWYARSLGSRLLGEISDGDIPLVDALAHAINHVRALHTDTCDLEHPASPSSTVIAIRPRAGLLEYLVLADSVLVVDQHNRDPTVITDDREAQVGRELRKPMDALPADSPEHRDAFHAYVEALRASRNVPGGFWVASSTPDVAGEALTGALPLERVRAVAALTDGASRLIDRFGLMSWGDAVKVLDTTGPAELIARTRDAERADPQGQRWPRGKAHDDATAAYLRT